MTSRTAATLAMCVVLGGCGKEVGRVAFTGEGTASSTATLAAGDVAFWTDVDIEYEGTAALGYSIELEQGGTTVASATCNPLGGMSVKTGWVEMNVGSSHSRSGNGKMSCTAKVPAAGATTVKATLAFGSRPTTLTLKKADLVLKQ